MIGIFTCECGDAYESEGEEDRDAIGRCYTPVKPRCDYCQRELDDAEDDCLAADKSEGMI